MSGATPTLRERLAAVERRIADACERAGRQRREVTLVGASKTQPAAAVEEAWREGLRVVGENRVQEALAKAAALPKEIEWHLIGPLQSNKVRPALELFRTFHAIDREKIARILDREAAERELAITGLLEVNLADEDSKHGFAPGRLLAGELDELAALEHLDVVGLMAIPPFERDLQAARRWFARLRELRDRLAERSAWRGWPGWLSMGMSHDLEAAILEGATHVRVGTALFGPRG